MPPKDLPQQSETQSFKAPMRGKETPRWSNDTTRPPVKISELKNGDYNARSTFPGLTANELKSEYKIPAKQIPKNNRSSIGNNTTEVVIKQARDGKSYELAVNPYVATNKWLVELSKGKGPKGYEKKNDETLEAYKERVVSLLLEKLVEKPDSEQDNDRQALLDSMPPLLQKLGNKIEGDIIMSLEAMKLQNEASAADIVYRKKSNIIDLGLDPTATAGENLEKIAGDPDGEIPENSPLPKGENLNVAGNQVNPDASEHPEYAPVIDAEGDQHNEIPMSLSTVIAFSYGVDTRHQRVAAETSIEHALETRQQERGFFRKLATGFYQNSLLSGVFRERERRQRLNMMQRANLPLLSDQLYDEAIKFGKDAVKKRNWLRRGTIDAAQNLFASLAGFQTTDRIEAEKWLRNSARRIESGGMGDYQVLEGKDGTVADNDTRQAFLKEKRQQWDELESFANRLAIRDENIAINVNRETREQLEDGALKDGLIDDFFAIYKEYLNGDIAQVPSGLTAAERQEYNRDRMRVRIDAYMARGGVRLPNGQVRSLQDRLGNRFGGFTQAFATVGTNMQRIADYFSTNKDGYIAMLQDKGITLAPPNNKFSDYLQAAYQSNKLDFEIFVANQAEINAGLPVSMRERVFSRLRGMRPEFAGNIAGAIDNITNSNIARGSGAMLRSAAFNEFTVGYATAWLTSVLPLNPTKAHAFALAGISTPLAVVTSAGAVPLAVAVGATALSVGLYAAVKEGFRVHRYKQITEIEASRGVVFSKDTVKMGRAMKLIRGLYGATDKVELQQFIADQRSVKDLTTDLMNATNLFSDSTKLNSPMREISTYTPDDVRKAIALLGESAARIQVGMDRRRRLLKFDSALSENAQMETLNGVRYEVLERVNEIIRLRPDLEDQLLQKYRQPANGEQMPVGRIQDIIQGVTEVYANNFLTGTVPDRLTLLRDELNMPGDQMIDTVSKSLQAKDRAARWLYVGKAANRFLGVGVSTIVGGTLFSEARHAFFHGPPGLISNVFRGEGNSIAPTGVAPQEYQWRQPDNSIVSFRIPQGFKITENLDMVSPSGRYFNLNEDGFGFNSSGTDFNAATKSAFEQLGIKVDGQGSTLIYPDKTLLTATDTDPYKYTNPNEFNPTSVETVRVETPSAIKLGSSGLVQGNIDRITVNGNEESLLSMYGQSFDPSNKAEMDQLAFYLKRDFHLNMNGTSISVDHGGAVHDIVTQLQGEKASGGAVFEKLNTHVDQMGSYTNGTNFPDKNELMLYTYKGQPDRMILDISHMGISTGIGLNPPEVNIAQLAANPTPTMSAGFYFSFQNPAQGGIFVPVGANGTLTLDPHDTTHFFTSDSGARVSYGDLSRMLVDKDALAAAGDTPMDGGKVDIATELSGQRSVWNVDKIQAVVRRTDGGTTILNSVATITGMPHGKMPAEITYWTEGKADPTSFTPIHTTTTYDLSTSQNTTVFNLSYQGEEGYLEEVIVPLNYTDMARDNRDEGTRGNYTKIPVGWVENNNRAPAPAPIAGANRGGPAAGGIERVDVDGLNITKDRFTEWLSKLNENFSDDLLQNWLKAEYLQNIDPAQVDAKLALIMADTVFTDARAQWLKEWSTSRTNALVNAITAAPLAIFSPDTIKELNRIKSEMNDKIQDIETNGITNATQAAIALYLDNERGQKLLSITKESDGKFKIKYQNLFGNSVQQEADYTVSQLIPMLLRDKVKEDIIEKIYHVPPSATTTILGANWFPKVGELRQKYNDTIASMKDPAHSNEHFSFIKEDTYLPIARSSEVAGRLYINPYNDHVPEVAEAVIQKLKEYNRANPTEPLEIQMKLLTPEKLYPEVTGMKPLNDDQLYRPDKMVLYFKEQDVEQIFQIMREVHSEFEKGANKIFSTRTPLLTAQLKDENGNPLNGMAFAEQPRKRMGRDTAYSGEVAYALYNLVADAQGDIDEVYVKQNIGKYLDNANIDPEHPGLLATRSEFTGVARDFIVNNTLSSIAQGVAPYAAAA